MPCVSIPKVLLSTSTNTGLNPHCRTEAMSDTHVNGGTITSPPNGFLILSNVNDSKLAEAPELTNTEYFTPNHLDHSSSNARQFGPLVRIGSSCFKCSMTASNSLLNILFRINGYFIITSIRFMYNLAAMCIKLKWHPHFNRTHFLFEFFLLFWWY